jgi:5-methylcytosine-specific restriction endonuclease McrA
MKNKYTITYLKEIVKQSNSIREVLENLNIIPAGGNYQTVKRKISENNIDTSHFTGQAWNKGKKLGPKRSIEDYLSNKQPIQSWKLKRRLLQDKFFEPKCYGCSNRFWLDQPIPLELHHIDGDNTNNNLSNLTILCPNCHALTDNYRGKNK